jgi:hypothetical protein
VELEVDPVEVLNQVIPAENIDVAVERRPVCRLDVGGEPESAPLMLLLTSLSSLSAIRSRFETAPIYCFIAGSGRCR